MELQLLIWKSLERGITTTLLDTTTVDDARIAVRLSSLGCEAIHGDLVSQQRLPPDRGTLSDRPNGHRHGN